MFVPVLAALVNQNCMVFPCLNSKGLPHVSLSLSICLEAMWCIWMFAPVLK